MAAEVTIDPGVDTLQAGLSSVDNGGTLYLNDGVYTTAGAYLAYIHSALTGKVFDDLTIQSVNPRGAILDFGTPSSTGLRVGDSSGVKFRDMKWANDAPAMITEDNPAHGYEFDGVDLVGVTSMIPFKFGGFGQSMVIRDIATDIAFGSNYLIDIDGDTTELDLLIDGIDMSLNDGTVLIGIQITNCRDVRLRNLIVDGTTSVGIALLSNDLTKGLYDITMSNAQVSNTGGVGIHTGNASNTGFATERVHLSDIKTTDTGRYGVEFENGAINCSLTGFRITNATNHGVALAEETEQIVVQGGVIDSVQVGGALNSGIIAQNSRRNIIQHNVIYNCQHGIQLSDAPGFAFDGKRNIVRNNIIFGCQLNYYMDELPASGFEHMIGPNLCGPASSSFAGVGATPYTQAQWDVAIADSLDASDAVVADAGALLFVDVAGGDFRTYPSAPATTNRDGFYVPHPHTALATMMMAAFAGMFSTGGLAAMRTAEGVAEMIATGGVVTI
jgi:hypothetical protein